MQGQKGKYKKVKSITFGMVSPKLIKKIATIKIITPELYDNEGYPVDGGLMDTRMGVIDPGLRCRVCGGKIQECNGHFGYIELARPVVHIKFAPMVYDLLRGTCRDCGRVLIPEEKIEDYAKKLQEIEETVGIEARRDAINEMIKELRTKNKCPHCKAKQKKIDLEKPTTFLEDDKPINTIEVRARLEKIPNEDLKIFGLNSKVARPEWMVLTLFLIPPVTMRPSLTLESGERSEDDLTHKLGDIVRINQRLFENITAGAPEIIIEDLWELLQYHVTTFFDNNVPQLPVARHRTGQPLKTITERIKSKEGRIRYNLAGKRTNFSARTLISPDPMIGLNEVGIPIEIAMKLTIPETITSWNKEYLLNFVKNGPDVYPGANYIVRPDGRKKAITEEMLEQILEELQEGYVVERHLMDGDITIFNRQPSIHRMSIMCHKVRVLPYRTFRINPAVAHPYNADYDGDEMNIHVPQTREAMAEAEILMEVQTQIVSPRFGLSIIGCIQDAISGGYLLTTENKIPRKRAVELLTSIGVTDFSKLPDKENFDGNEVMSMIFPHDFNFVGKTLSGDELIIKNGKIIKGFMDAANLGQEAGLMLRNIYKRYKSEKTLDILGKLFKIGTLFVSRDGFSTGIEDSDLPSKARREIQKALDTAYEEIDDYIKKYKKEKLEIYPGKTMKETLEVMVLKRLNKVRDETGEIVKKYARQDSGIMIMSKSGARGKPLNLSQMAGLVGQQSLRGKRISKGFKGRALSYFEKGDLGAEAHGFIKSSFKDGMNPAEFVFMAMTGRDSLMDTALRTPKSGYLYRRLSNAMQDLKSEYDGTVRDASKKIIQFNYGEDGIDISKSEAGTIDIKRIVKENTM